MTVTDAKPREKQQILILCIRPPSISQDQARLKAVNEELRKRLKSFSYKEALEKAPELTIKMENEDLFWIDDGSQGGAIGVANGTLVDFQVGYLDPIDQNFDQLSLLRTHTISGEPSIARNEYTFKAATEAQNVLGATVKPQWAKRTKISEIVRIILDQAGFDENHRIIQDTKYEKETVAITSQETVLQFLYRLARGLNYRFYLTPGADGKKIAHFHKPGFEPSKVATEELNRSLSLLEVLRAQARKNAQAFQDLNVGTFIGLSPNLTVAIQAKPESSFGEIGNGNRAPARGVIRYRPSAPMDSDVLDFKISVEMDGTPATMQAIGADTKQGRIVNEIVSEGDKDEAPLSPRSPYASPTVQNPAFTFALGTFAGIPGNIAAAIGATPEQPTEDKPVVETGRNKEVEIRARLERRHGIASRAIALVADTPKDQAKDHAKAYLEAAQAGTVTIEMTLIGQPDMIVGDIWLIEGLKKFSGRYLLESLHHTFDTGGGFKTQTSFTSDGVDAKENPKSERADRDPEIRARLVRRPLKTARALQLVASDGSVKIDPEGTLDKKVGQ